MHFFNRTNYCFLEAFNESTILNLPKNTSVIYRNYKNINNIGEIIQLKKICKKHKKKLYLSNNILLSIKLGLDGAYIPSFNRQFWHNNYSIKKKFKFLGSAHNLKEIRIKEKQKVELIFISPLFPTKNKKKCLGIYKFIILKNLTKIPVACLGGINSHNIKQIKLVGSLNIGGIKMFKLV